MTTQTNFDPAEVHKFDEMAAQWWDPHGPCKPLHDLNPLRLAFIQSCCTLSNQKILDVGCGGGILTESMSRFSPFVLGIDQSTKALEVARLHDQSLNNPPTYELGTVEDFVQQTRKFDIITCMEMLEHVPDPLSVIQACTSLLREGGHLFFSTLNRTSKSFLYAIVGAEYLLNILPRGTHSYERFIRPSELATWCRSQGLYLKNIKGIKIHPFSKSYALSDDVSVNYLMHLQKGEE